MENRSNIGQGVVKRSWPYYSQKFLIAQGFSKQKFRSEAVIEAKIFRISRTKKSVKKSAKERSNDHDRFILGYSLVSKNSPKKLQVSILYTRDEISN